MSDASVVSSFRVAPSTAAIGADVYGLDLSRGLTEGQVEEVRKAFLEHQVLFFREQSRIEPGALLALGRLFGTLHHHPSIPHLAGYPGIMEVKADKDSRGHFGPRWHSDVSCEAEPPLGTILQVHLPPPVGGDTLFASAYGVYDRLSEPMRRFLAGLEADHELYGDRLYGADGNPTSEKKPLGNRHPVIRTHPETGRQGVFVNRIFTKRIAGLSPGESQNLLEFLFRQFEDPYVQVRLQWKRNDVAFWDNRCTQHVAIWDYWPHERVGHRVTILGDKPFYRASV
jgi:taurine dioxygenase